MKLHFSKCTRNIVWAFGTLFCVTLFVAFVLLHFTPPLWVPESLTPVYCTNFTRELYSQVMRIGRRRPRFDTKTNILTRYGYDDRCDSHLVPQ
jgi:hypothetical protein